MIRLQIQLEERQAEKLKDVAKRRHVSAASIIREALDHALVLEPPSERMKAALAMVGKYSGGPSDVSERHDDYYAEAIEALWKE